MLLQMPIECILAKTETTAIAITTRGIGRTLLGQFLAIGGRGEGGEAIARGYYFGQSDLLSGGLSSPQPSSEGASLPTCGFCNSGNIVGKSETSVLLPQRHYLATSQLEGRVCGSY